MRGSHEIFWHGCFVTQAFTLPYPNELRSAKYELRLLMLIDQGISFHRGDSWKELEQQLSREQSPVQYDIRKLFYFPTACGMYLATLAKKCPERVVKLPRGKINREWEIRPLPERLYPGMVISKPSTHGEN